MNIVKNVVSLVMIALIIGCTPRAEVAREEAIVLHEKRGCVITVLLDLSGSFHSQMVDGGKAHQFCLAILDTYFKDRIGEKDEIVIAQISGADRALLWAGTPMRLRQDFADPKAFKRFLESRADPSQSKVLQNFAKSVEYVASDPDVTNGTAKSAVFVLSDMRDNDPNQDAARERLKKALERYATNGGVVGCYYVDQDLVGSCRNFLAESGVHKFKVDADIVGNPQLPVID
jgi:hypothetical protein